MQENGVFVKLNYKTIGEFKSLIIDKEDRYMHDKRYVMCAGKYTKEGWTFVFKANSINEAEQLINNDYLTVHNNRAKKAIIDNKVHMLEQERVEIPYWM